MKDIKLIAFDLDGTLFTTDKRITERTLKALKAAADKGIAIVPATGRFMMTIPEPIKKMDYITYIISINGAYVYNTTRKAPVYRAEIQRNKAIEILNYLDMFYAAYDCYMDNEGLMTSSMMDNIHSFIKDPFYLDLLMHSRMPVDELKAYILSGKSDIQKIMAYTADEKLKAHLMDQLPKRFDGLSITSSIKENIEINDEHANKGKAVIKIAEDMGISLSQVMTFGDSYNDIPMLKAAGVGVCMANGADEAKAVSQIIAPSNDDDGVAYVIEKEVLS